MNSVVLLGAGGHAKVIVDTINKYHRDIRIVGITDCNEACIGKEILGIPIIGNDSILPELYRGGVSKAFITLGMIKHYKPRLKLYELVKSEGFELINVNHGSCIISDFVTMGNGNAILSGAIINANTKVGNNCIINSGSIIEHDCSIGDNAHIAPGVRISGGVKIGDNCMIGIGAIIIQGINVGKNSIVGAGSVVLKDVPPYSVVYGVPAKVVKMA